MANQLTLPNNSIVTDGTKVQIVNSDTYYVLHNGYYVYDGSVKSGWYLQSLVDSSCTPLENISTSDIIVNNNAVSVPISNNRSQESTPRFYPNKTITSVNVGEKHSYNHAFITVNTINDRDLLKYVIEVPHGKLVRVNNVDGIIKYYAYNKPNDIWEEIEFAPDMSEYATKTYVHEAIAGDMSEFIQALQLIPVSEENGGDTSG